MVVRVRGFAPSVSPQFVQGGRASGAAGDIVSRGLNSAARGVGQLAAGLQAQQDQQEKTEYADSLSAYSDFQFDMNRELDELDRTTPADSRTFYAQADTLVRNKTNEWRSKVNPKFLDKFNPQLAGHANSRLEWARGKDNQRKTNFFVTEAQKMWNKQGVTLQNNPDALEDASRIYEEYVVNTELSTEEKAKLLFDGKTELGKIAYAEEKKREVTRGPQWVESNIDRLTDMVFGIENATGDPTIKNPNSTATGNAQMTEGTWMRFIKEVYPEFLTQGTGKEILELRKDPEFARESGEWYIKTVGKHLARNGLPVNDATIYLGYFLGEGGVVAALTAHPEALTSTFLGRDSIDSNKKILKNKTAEQVLAWAAKKTGQAAWNQDIDNDPRFDLVGPVARQQATRDARIAAAKQIKAQEDARDNAQKAALDNFLVNIRDDKVANPRTEFDRMREEGIVPNTNSAYTSFNSAVKDHDERVEKAALFQGLTSGALVFNPQDAKHREVLDAGAEQAALPLIGKRHTGAAKEIADLIGAVHGTGAPTNAIQSLKALGMSANTRDALYGVSQLAQLRLNYPELIEGMVGDDMAKRLALYNPDDPTETNIASLGLGEDANSAQLRVQRQDIGTKLFKEAETAGDVSEDRIFDFVFGSAIPFAGYDADDFRQDQKGIFYSDYKQRWTQGFAMSGRPDTADKYAKEMIQRSWGITELGGRARLMKNPPHKVPGLDWAVGENESFLTDQLRFEAGEQFKAFTGQKMTDGHRVLLTSDTQTGQDLAKARVAAGASQDIPPVTYSITVVDEEGIPQYQSSPRIPGSRFFFDVGEIEKRNEENFLRKIRMEKWLRNQDVRRGEIYGDLSRRYQDAPVPPSEVQPLPTQTEDPRAARQRTEDRARNVRENTIQTDAPLSRRLQ